MGLLQSQVFLWREAFMGPEAQYRRLCQSFVDRHELAGVDLGVPVVALHRELTDIAEQLDVKGLPDPQDPNFRYVAQRMQLLSIHNCFWMCVFPPALALYVGLLLMGAGHPVAAAFAAFSAWLGAFLAGAKIIGWTVDAFVTRMQRKLAVVHGEAKD